MLISQSVKNIISGISQQPPVLRLPEQLEEQINGFSTEASGLQKRPPTQFIKVLEGVSGATKPLIHFVERDSTERYIMYFYDNSLHIFDLEGNPMEIEIAEDADYLKSKNPRADLKVLTIADYTFILNKNVVVKMTDDKSPDSFNTQGALAHVKSGQYGRTYSLIADGKEIASYTTPNGSDASHVSSIDTHNIAANLYNQAVAKGYSCTLGDTWVHIKGVKKIESRDGYNNQAMVSLTSTIQKFSLLPSTAPDGYVVKVKSDPDSSTGEYFIRYNATDKIWEECVAPNMTTTIDAATMPHVLIRQSDGTFKFQKATWDDREAGDNDSNPEPSFIGLPLNDIFFHKNRLGLLAGENIILSESSSYYNFWMVSATDVVDTDTIDVAVTTTQINNLIYAVPFNEELYCFSSHSQFVLRSDTTLTPKNCALIEVTGFDSTPNCRPVASGKNLYFATERAEYTNIKEYYSVENVSDIKNAQDISSHCPNYIPNGVHKITSNTNENILLVQTEGEPSSLFVYKYLFLNEQRVQASWSKWTFKGEVLGVFFIASTCYIIINYFGLHTLEKMQFTYDTIDYEDEPYRVYLDSKKLLKYATYNGANEDTTIDVLKEYGNSNIPDGTMGVVDNQGVYQIIDVSNGKAILNGDWTNKPVYIGFIYNFKATLSTLYIHSTSSSGTTKSILNGRLQLRYLHINYDNTGGFTVIVKNHRGKEYSYQMTTRQLGTPETRIGVVPSATGTFKVPLQMLNTSCAISIESDLPLPLAIIGYLWEATFVPKSREV